MLGVCLAVGAYGILTAWLVPITVRVAYDPSIQYMFASLAWFRGTPYAYIDHPGTPVEIVGSVLLFVSHPFVRHASELIDFHLTHPQYFLSVAQTGVVAASLAVCVWLGCRSVDGDRHWSLALLGVAIAGLYFAIHPMAFQSVAEWSHESFNFPAGTGLSLGLLVLARRARQPGWRWVLAAGFGAGALTSIQLYFAAWVVGTAVALASLSRLNGAAWLSTIGRSVVVFGMAAVGFVVSTLPIRDRYGDFGAWVWNLTFHEETYGSGAPGFSTPQLMLTNALAEFAQAPILALAVLLVGAVLAWRLSVDARRSGPDHVLWSVGLGMACQSLVLIALAAKHPGVKYLLPLAATLPVALATALGQASITRSGVAVAATLGVLGIAALGGALWSSVSAHLTLSDALARGDLATQTLLDRAAVDRETTRPALRTLWTYGTTSPCYALWFGDETTGQAFTADIDRLCPRDLNLSVFSAQVIAAGKRTRVDEFSDWDAALIPEEFLRTRPAAVPRGERVASSVPSLGYGNLVLFINPDRAAQRRDDVSGQSPSSSGW